MEKSEGRNQSVEQQLAPDMQKGQQLSAVERIERNFQYHPPKGDQQERYVQIRDEAKRLAHTINELSPPSREQSLAFTALEETVMWANAAIARNE